MCFMLCSTHGCGCNKNMLRKFLKSREAKKLFRNKSAIVALVVIAGYLLVALAMMGDVISRDDCAAVVGPNSVPGFYLQEAPERRYEIARTSLFGKVKRALGKSNPLAALAEVQLGKLRVADKGLAELQQIVDEAVAIQGQP